MKLNPDSLDRLIRRHARLIRFVGRLRREREEARYVRAMYAGAVRTLEDERALRIEAQAQVDELNELVPKLKAEILDRERVLGAEIVRLSDELNRAPRATPGRVPEPIDTPLAVDSGSFKGRT